MQSLRLERNKNIYHEKINFNIDYSEKFNYNLHGT